ncbi:DUF6249 domain-containing protein, partial [Candidatus Latescibacterota bacterium]
AVIFIFGSIPAIIIFIASRRHKEKMELINRGVNMPIHSQAASVNTGSKPLLWGLIAVAIGLALLLSAFAVQRNVDRDLVTFSLFFLFGGCATLLYWKLTKKERDEARALNEAYMKKMIESYKTPENVE